MAGKKLTSHLPSLVSNNQTDCVTANTELFGERGLFTSDTSGQASYFFGQFGIEFHMKPVGYFAKCVRSLKDAIFSIFRFRSRFEMVGINAPAIVNTGAFVQHDQSLGNRPNAQNPTGNMCRYRLERPILKVPPVDLSVSMVRGTRPKPALVRSFNINLRPKPLRERGGKSLRNQVLSGNIESWRDHRCIRYRLPETFQLAGAFCFRYRIKEPSVNQS